MVDYNQQEYLLLKSLFRALRRAEYWTQQVAKAQNEKQVELWSKIRSEAYGHIENCIYMLDWLNEKRPKNLELEPEPDIIVAEPKTTAMLIDKPKMHRSFGGILIKNGE